MKVREIQGKSDQNEKQEKSITNTTERKLKREIERKKKEGKKERKKRVKEKVIEREKIRQ